eukprot:278669_1
MTDNINGTASMKPVKNPGKLKNKMNLSMWENTPKKDENKPKTRKKKKKKKSAMSSMWENKLAKEKEANASSKSHVPKKKKNWNFTPKNDTSTTTTSNGADSPPKKINKVSALAAGLNINPMGLKGGLPPSLRKKREEQKEKEADIPDAQFAKPIIPSSARRKQTKKNIINLENEKINQSLKAYLSESFTFDEEMIINDNYLLLYLRDFAGIDLSSCDNDNKWDKELLLSCLKEVYGDKVESSWGFKIRAI